MELNTGKYDEKSCGLVLFRKENGINFFLILHYPGGHFDFPKGHVEENEDEKQTAARELTEETGITDIEFIDGFRDHVSYVYRRKGILSKKQVVYFLAKTTTKEITLSHEHQGYVWLPYEKALKKISFDNSREILKKAVKLI